MWIEGKSQAIQTNSPALSIFEKRLILSAILLLILNLLDVQLTLWGIKLHLIEEGNPLVQSLILKNPLYLKEIKLLLPLILGAACWRVRNTSPRLVVYGMALSITVYLWIMAMHVHWLYKFSQVLFSI